MKKLIRNLFFFVVGAIGGSIFAFWWGKKRIDPVLKKYKNNIDKFRDFYWLLLWWVKNYQDGVDLTKSFKEKGYKRIAIYGAKELGERMYFELKRAGIEVPYFIDQSDMNEILMDKIVRVMNPSEEIIGVDAVVVTAISYFNEIYDNISLKCDCPVISLEDVVFRA